MLQHVEDELAWGTMAASKMPTCICHRIAAPCCSLIASKVLKQRPATVKRAADVCLDFVELEQADAVEVRIPWPLLLQGNPIIANMLQCALYDLISRLLSPGITLLQHRSKLATSGCIADLYVARMSCQPD